MGLQNIIQLHCHNLFQDFRNEGQLRDRPIVVQRCNIKITLFRCICIHTHTHTHIKQIHVYPLLDIIIKLSKLFNKYFTLYLNKICFYINWFIRKCHNTKYLNISRIVLISCKKNGNNLQCFIRYH